MPSLKINDKTVEVERGASLMAACFRAGAEVPHYCHHPCLRAAGSCRMCVVEVKGQQKLVASCGAEALDGMEVRTETPAIAEARAAVVEFLLLDHPLDCPICDKAGECRLQDYAHRYGGRKRLADGPQGARRDQGRPPRFAFEDLGSKLVMDKNRCVHCTRCVRFLRDVAGTCELAPTGRGAGLEMAAFDGLGGAALDANPFAGNLADICPVGAITAKALRFRKRAWYLRPVPTISRHGADAKPVWADVDQNRVWRLRPRVESPDGTDSPARFITDEERWAFERYGRHGRAEGPVAPTLGGSAARARDIARALEAGGPVAVVAQGAFGCGALQALAGLATSDSLRYAHGNRRIPVHSQAMQGSDDGAINRAGAIAAGYRFGALPELLSRLEAWEVKSVVLYHDAWFSNDAENALLGRILEKAAFSVLLEPVPSGLAALAKATLPVTTYLEESDSIIDHRGAARRYEKAVEPPPGALAPAAWAAELVGAAETIGGPAEQVGA